MGHPRVDNRTPFAFEPIFIADEDLRPVVVAVVKGTFTLDLDGHVALADEQKSVSLDGERATDAPVSSYKYEPEIALHKPATDVVLIGHAQPGASGSTEVTVGIKAGPVQKVARVHGDRFWLWTSQGVVKSRTRELEPVPLIWENAFGGRDEVNSSAERPLLEPRNPVGTGFGTPLSKDGDYLRIPNIEDPNQPLTEYGAVVEPYGFGFTSPNWKPRARFAGTYDQAWEKRRKPRLPVDFDRRFFNAAAPGLIAPGYLCGDEDIVVLNTTQVSHLVFSLPAVPPPVCRFVVHGQPDTDFSTNLDTVIVDTDRMQLVLLWRVAAPAGNGPHDVSDIVVTGVE